jgi:SapC
VINSALYRDPVLLDPAQHRRLRMAVLRDFSITKGMHAVFVTATEFLQAGLEFPILFVHSGERDAEGRLLLSPIVLLGLTQGENLCVKGPAWDARYIPAFIRRFPFLTANLKGANAPGVLIDKSWSGLSETEGEPLFDEHDQPAPALKQAMQFLEMFDLEAQRTRMFCARLAELNILKEMKADATLPDGKTLSVDGFYAVDDEKLRELPDSSVLELHRNGMLMLLQMHLASLANLRHLVDRKALVEAA